MTPRTTTRRHGWARWLMLALLVIPVVEVFLILQVGHAIGGWETFGLLVLWSAIGAWIVKREAGRAFGALHQAFATGRMPTRELSDAALVLIGGTLLLAPGFLTDAIGLFVLLPFTRPFTRRLLEGAIAARLFGASRVSVQTWTSGAAGPAAGPGPESVRSRRTPRSGPDEIIEGEIID